MSTRTKTGLVLVLLILAGLAISQHFLNPNSGGGRSNPDVAGVRALVRDQQAAFQRQDWKALYNTGSPRVRSVCTYADFLVMIDEEAQGLRMRGGDWSQFGIKIERVTITSKPGSKAATYTDVTTLNGHDFGADEAADPQTAVYVDGQWWDDNRGHTGCA